MAAGAAQPQMHPLRPELQAFLATEGARAPLRPRRAAVSLFQQRSGTPLPCGLPRSAWRGTLFRSGGRRHWLTVAQHLEDLDVVIDDLRQAYAKEKIYLVGHSWGTVLGLLHAKAHPKTVAALISVAPVVSFNEQQRREYDFDLAEAKRRGESDTVAELQKLGVPPYEAVDKVAALERITTRYGGVDFEPRNRTAIVIHGVLLGLATPWEIPRFIGRDFMSPSGPCMRSCWASICARK